MPELENVMNNFMQCTQTMMGPKVRSCITYKVNQRSFEVHKRKYQHEFRVPITSENLEGAIGREFTEANIFTVSKINSIDIYDSNSFKKVGSVPIELLKENSREPN